MDRYSQAWGGRGKVSPATADRIAIGSCAVIWLVLVGVSVAALVALMDLGRGFHSAKGNPHTSSVLYAIIVISALIILAAIPMLLRARRMTREAPATRSPGPSARTVSSRSIRSGPMAGMAHGSAERITPQRATLPDAEVDRFWLRGTVALM